MAWYEEEAQKTRCAVMDDARIVGGSSDPGQGARRRTISDSLVEQAKVIDEMQKLVAVLAQRLSPLLEPEPANAEATAKDPREDALNVMARIDKHTRELASIAYRVNNVAHRVQL